ncbi:hypothetical protein BDF22DRAFT_656479 [Syncephalis plumigaleata]|nr:hypothetical protein BDF22DRAFT_656479 [Syncephalis plumigaleata]
MFRAAEKFHQHYQRYPGQQLNKDNDEMDSANIDEDIRLFTDITRQCLEAWHITEIPDDLLDDNIREWCRYGHAELHNIAALMGGVTAQEVIKLVTHQYVPLNHTCIYNGIRGATQSFDF